MFFVLLVVATYFFGEILSAQMFLEEEKAIHFNISMYDDKKVSSGMKHFIDRVKFNNSRLTHVSRSGLIVDTGTPGIFATSLVNKLLDSNY